MLLDLALDLLVPPLSFIAVGACAGTTLATYAWIQGYAGLGVWAAWAACPFMVATYVARGVVLSGAGLRGVVDLAAAPAYVAWKLALRMRRKGDGAWVRTSREGDRTR